MQARDKQQERDLNRASCIQNLCQENLIQIRILSAAWLSG